MAKKSTTLKSVVPKPKTAKKSASNSKFINPRTDFGFKPVANKESKVNKKIFTEILTEAELANLSPDELDLYDKSLKNYNKNMTPREIIKEYQKINAALQKEVAELEEYRRRYGALNGAKPTLTKVRATRAKVTV